MKKILTALIVLALSMSVCAQTVTFAETENNQTEIVEKIEDSENKDVVEEDAKEEETATEDSESESVENSDEVVEGEETIEYPVIPEFSDMPNNWTTDALINAVKNGLLNGSDGKIMPDDNITRAQMAAIIVRAFGAKAEADISMFTDVSSDKWYYSEFARAVQMKAFNGTDDLKLNPDNNITFQECFAVVARVFGLPAVDESCLDAFADKGDIAQWAIPEVSKIIGFGYWDGIENKLTPTEYITRSEFAVLMDNLVKTYINTAGEYKDLPEGNVLIRSNDVVLNNIVSDGLIIVGDAVDVDNKIYLNNINSTGQIIVRGGETYVSGNINGLRVINSGLYADISKVSERTGKLYIAKDSNIFFGTANIMPTTK